MIMNNNYKEELLENNFILETNPENHFRVYLRDFVSFFNIDEKKFLEENIIKNSINPHPTQITFSMMKTLDESVFSNKEETLNKFNDYIMPETEDSLKDFKYLRVHLVDIL